MYVIQLSTTSTNNVGIYIKRGIVVFRNLDEYNDIVPQLDVRTRLVRKKRIYRMVELNKWMPSEVKVPLLYVEYRFKQSEDWEKDLVEILDTGRRKS